MLAKEIKENLQKTEVHNTLLYLEAYLLGVPRVAKGGPTRTVDASLYSLLHGSTHIKSYRTFLELQKMYSLL